MVNEFELHPEYWKFVYLSFDASSPARKGVHCNMWQWYLVASLQIFFSLQKCFHTSLFASISALMQKSQILLSRSIILSTSAWGLVDFENHFMVMDNKRDFSVNDSSGSSAWAWENQNWYIFISLFSFCFGSGVVRLSWHLRITSTNGFYLIKFLLKIAIENFNLIFSLCTLQGYQPTA